MIIKTEKKYRSRRFAGARKKVFVFMSNKEDVEEESFTRPSLTSTP